MPVVWVVNAGGHKYDAASEYGDMKNLTVGNANVFSTDRVVQNMVEKLHDSCSEDWLLLSGSIVLNIAACVELIRKHGRVNLLMFDLRTQDYKKRIITIQDFEDASKLQEDK
jgi:hypothetical protein